MAGACFSPVFSPAFAQEIQDQETQDEGVESNAGPAMLEARWDLLWRRVQAIRLDRLKKVLHLNEAQAGRLIPKLQAIDEKKREIGKRRLSLLRELRAVTKERGRNAEEIKRLLGEMEANNSRLSEVKKEIETLLAEELGPEQQARYLLFQQKFKKELRELIRKEKRGMEEEEENR
ncbi:MAG: hypothetical protein WAO55_00525 [Candidatus Manganitrophaceae bacterium]